MSGGLEYYLPKLSASARRWLRFFAVLAALTLLCLVVYRLRTVFTPLLIAAALAYIFNPVVTWLEQRAGMQRLTTVVVIFALLGGLVLTGGFALYSKSVAQLQQFQGDLPRYIDRLGTWIVRVRPAFAAPGLPAPVMADPTTQGTELNPQTTQPVDWWRSTAPLIKEYGITLARRALMAAGAAFSSVAAIASLLVLIPMFTFYFLWRFNDGVRLIRDFLPFEYRPAILHILLTIDAAVANFFRGRLLVCIGVGLASAIGWTIVGVPYSLPLGMLAGALNLVPFMSLLALPPVLLFAWMDAGDQWFWPVVLAMAVYLAVQALESFLLSPTIEGQASGLHPLVIVVALLIGAELAGLLGMLLAIPLASTLKTLAAEFVVPELRRLAGPPTGPPASSPAHSASGENERAEI